MADTHVEAVNKYRKEIAKKVLNVLPDISYENWEEAEDGGFTGYKTACEDVELFIGLSNDRHVFLFVDEHEVLNDLTGTSDDAGHLGTLREYYSQIPAGVIRREQREELESLRVILKNVNSL